MTQPEPTREYLDTLLVYYEEEITGKGYFWAFAERLPRPAQAQKMRLLADVGHHAANAVLPLLARYGLTPRPQRDLFAIGRAQANQARPDWAASLAEMRRTFPGYIEDFERLEAMAPPKDLPVLRFLTDHEHAAISFLELEQHDPPASTQPLTA